MNKELILTTYMVNGSYAYLIQRQVPVLREWGYNVKVVLDVFNNSIERTDEQIIYYTTYNNIIPFYKKFKHLKNVIIFSDSALITSPYVSVSKIINDTGWAIVTPAQFNYNLASKVIKSIKLVRHFVPDLPKRHNITINPFEQRKIYLTVGINEKDFDRKGHYWNFVAQTIGLNAVRVCTNNFCFGGKRVDENTLFQLFNFSKFYLGMSHAETPHLPTLESYAFKTPAILLDAHEFHYLPGIKVRSSFSTVKGQRNFYFFEVDPVDFVSKLLDTVNMTKEDWSALSNEAYEFYEKYIKMENRRNEFEEMLNLLKR